MIFCTSWRRRHCNSVVNIAVLLSFHHPGTLLLSPSSLLISFFKLIFQIRALNSNGARDSKLYPHTRMQLSNYGSLPLKIQLQFSAISFTSVHRHFYSNSYLITNTLLWPKSGTQHLKRKYSFIYQIYVFYLLNL